MKNLILTLMASAALSAISPAFAMEGPQDKESSCISAYKGLKWQDRPPEIQTKIDETFFTLACMPTGSWSYNGSKSYYIAGVEEVKLAKYLITSNHDQKEFYFLDIGAGNFQWGDNLAKEINKFTDITDDVKVNIIGVRGEGYDGAEFSTVGKCNIFKLGHFKIENLEEAFKTAKAFKSINLDLTGKIDCIYTRWCFRHLVDPVGTVEQAHNLLKPNIGLFFGDGFYYGLKGQSAKDLFTNVRSDNITKLLLDMKVQFLIEAEDGVTNNFVFKRNTDAPLNLPLKYTGRVCLGDTHRSVFSQAVTAFEHIGPEPEWIESIPFSSINCRLSGDLDLFNFFKNNKLFDLGEYEYSSLTEKK